MPKRLVIILLGFLLLVISCGEPSDPDELLAEGKKAFEAGDYQKAQSALREGLKIEPSDRDMLYYMGMCFKDRSLYDSAIAYLKRADIMHPKDREINEQLYEIAYVIGDWDIALSALSGLVATGDPIEEHYDEYAELWARKDHIANAYYWIRKAIEVDPDNQENYIRAAHLAVKDDSGPSPGEWIDSAIARFGESDRLLNAKATVLMQAEDFAEAERMFRNLYARDTANLMLRLNLARALASQESQAKKREAVKLYQSLENRLGSEYRVDSLLADVQTQIK
jgi:Flp pilus assembly protein TadD